MGSVPSDPCCAEIGTCESDPYDYRGHLTDVDTATIVLGTLMIVGTVISVVPQSIKLFIVKTTSGLSFQMLHMAVYSVWTTVCNYVTAQFSKMVACKDEPVKCNRDLISFYQSAFLFLVQFAVFV